eukprot:CAMPEP_0194089160 /NCGR_PEP_ID=MMETSP0149-20130528/32968_1 /TAXON_ID=122233 /ORGANISM="Chaetoceros debilis, Strain MM31A-1" /LENGTH=535 /DNA_ID=CAMNT_0038772993 /DNA_START=70 /DNA_END=1677 /DNA_ORIENTATION=+
MADTEYDEMDVDMNSQASDEFDMTHAEYKEEGNAAYKRKDYRTAIVNYTLAIEAARADGAEKDDPVLLATYYNNRAAASTMILQYDDAVNDCETSITIHPPFLKAYMRKSKAQVSLGQLQEATATLCKAAIHDPNNSAIVQQKQEVSKLTQRLELARQLLDKTNKKAPVYPPFPLPGTRDAQQALNQLNVVIASCPAWRALLSDKTKALVALNRVNEAYTLSTSVIRSKDGSNHHNSTVILYRAFALHHMGNLDDAVKHLKQILSGDPDNKSAFSFFKVLKALGKKKAEGDGYYKARNFEQAAEAYSEALALDGCVEQYRAKLFFNRACAHANERKHSNVVEDCTEALKLDSEYVKAIMRRAASNLLIGGESECAQAIRDYESAMDLAEKRGDEATQKDLKKKIRAAQVQLKRSKQKDFYKILNVGRDATEAEIKKSYRKSALKWHPDRHANSTEEKKLEAEKTFRDVNLAYEVLSDAGKKQKYDSGVDVEDLDNPHAGQGHGHGGHGGMDPNVLFQMFMQQQGGMGGGGGFHFG